MQSIILTLRRNGTVQNTQKISATTGGLTPNPLRQNSEFGQAISSLGDLDLDGVPDIVVSSDAFNDPTTRNGAVFVLFLNGTASGPINDPPVIQAIPNQSVTEGDELVIAVSAMDTDGPTPLKLSVTSQPSGSTFTDNSSGNGVFRWTPAVGNASASPFLVSFQTTDNAGASTSRQVSINVTPVSGGSNQAPVLSPIADQVVTVGQELRFTVQATDPDGPAPLILSATDRPTGTLFTGDPGDDRDIFSDNEQCNGVFSWVPAVGTSDISPVIVTFMATDNAGNGLSDSQQVRITVQPAPAASGNTSGGNNGGNNGGGGGSAGFLLLIGLFILRILAHKMTRTPKYQSHRS